MTPSSGDSTRVMIEPLELWGWDDIHQVGVRGPEVSRYFDCKLKRKKKAILRALNGRLICARFRQII